MGRKPGDAMRALGGGPRTPEHRQEIRLVDKAALWSALARLNPPAKAFRLVEEKHRMVLKRVAGRGESRGNQRGILTPSRAQALAHKSCGSTRPTRPRCEHEVKFLTQIARGI